jgi:hypothetical protein
VVQDPVALIGLPGYSAILASLRGRAELTAATAYIGLAFSAYLTWVELTGLRRSSSGASPAR